MKTKRLFPLLFLVPLLAAFAFVMRLPLTWTDQAVFSGILIALSIVVGRLSTARSTTLTLMMLSIFCTLRYGIWRWVSSITYLNHSGWQVDRLGLVFALLLLLAETYAVCILLLGFFQGARPLKRTPVPMPANTDDWPSVDVYIPSYNEPLDVVRPTVLAALGIDWPADRLQVYILDDGRRPDFRDFAAECGAGYITRFDNAHAKAGNINAALKKTTGEYIAIFDCDHIATRSFLQVTMGWFFRDRRLALVQTPHHFYSPDPFERNLNVFRKVPNEGALFYGIVQDGNDLWNATFFCGSCAVIRREALEQIGGIAVETVTEDAHTALRLQRLGWNTAYLGIPQAAGLATGSLSAHVGQRIRWARGMVQILRTECPLFVSGLKLPQRLCYLNCVVHYLYAIPRFIFMSAPLVYLIFGKSNLYGYIWEIVAYAAPHLVLSNMVNSRCQGDHRHSFWNEVYEMVLAPYILLPTTFALINPKWGKFNVTAKDSVIEESYFDWKIARPYLYLIALNLLGIGLAIPRYFSGAYPAGVLTINVFWAFMNLLLLGATVAVSFETKQRRSTVRIEAPLSATLELAGGEVHHCRVIDLSEGGLALRSERLLDVSAAQQAQVLLRAGDEENRFLVEAVRVKDNRIHLRFIENSLAHQRAITRIVYARADSWLDWTKDQRRDRILSSLVSVIGIGFHGLWLLPSLLIRRERKKEAGVKPGVQPAAAVKRAAALLPFLLLLAWPSRHLQAQSAPVQPGTRGFEDHRTLSDLGRKSAITLRGAHPDATLSFVIPSTQLVSAASFSVHYQAGQVSEPAAELAVTLNDVEVAALPLAPATQAETVSPITLPSDLLVHDNALGFHLRRACAGKPCTDTADDGPWVRIEPASQLAASGLVLALPNRLAMLPSPFFDPSVHRPLELPFVFGGSPDLPSLKAAGIVASWFGSLAGFRGTHFSPSIGQFPVGNAVLLALSNSEAAARLGLAAGSPVVALCDNPADQFGKVLALVAPDSAGLISLAQAVALGRVNVEADRAAVTPPTAAQLASASPNPPPSTSGKPVAIAQGLSEGLLEVKPDSAARLYFRVAPDLDFGTANTVALQLNFRVADLPSKEHISLQVQLNGVAVSQRKLEAPGASGVASESFAMPVSLVYPSNTLEVSLVTPASRRPGAGLSRVHLQILRDSTLDLTRTSHFVRMPRLDLFAASGFPFTSRPDLGATTFVVPAAPNAPQIGLYLDAAAFLSAQTATPAVLLNVVDSTRIESESERNLIIIGSSNDETVFQPFESEMVLKPSGGAFVSGDFSLPVTEWLGRAWIGAKRQRSKLWSLLAADAAPGFMLEEFVSPLHPGRTALVLATRSEIDTQPYFVRLADESRKGNIRGGLVLADEERFYAFDVAGRSYTLGETRSLAALYSWLVFHLWLLPVLLIAAAFVLARFWERYLEQVAARRLSAEA